MAEFDNSNNNGIGVVAAVRGGVPILPRPASWPVRSERAEGLVVQAIRSGKTCGYAGNDAPMRSRYEREAAEAAGYGFGVAVTNGTHAIAVALGAQLVLRGRAWAAGRSLIAGPTFTWVPGTYAGAKMGVTDVLDRSPSFKLFDANERDWTIDADAVVKWLHRNHSKVLGVVVPALLDTFPALDVIVAAAERFDLPVVFDGAQCGGARWEGEFKPATATVSLQLGKFEGGQTGEGGAVFCDDPVLAYVMRRFTDCGGLPAGDLDPLGGERPELPDGDWFPLVGNYRLSGTLGAAALGAREEMAQRLSGIRAVRAAIGTELVASSGLVVFRTPPVQAGQTPTYGWGMTLTEQAERELGLSADQWREVFAAEGFADDANGYKFGVRRPYGMAHTDPKMAGHLYVSGLRAFPNAEAIAARGLMFHVGHLLREETPRWLRETVDRAVRDIDGLRVHFDVTRS